MKKKWFILILFLTVALSASAQEIINLAGEWQFKLDPNNQGVEKQWFKKGHFSEEIRLPGCLQAQGYGTIPTMNTKWWGGMKLDKWFKERPWLKKYQDSANFQTQAWLVPDRHYIGAAWYATDVTIPSTWGEKQVQLFLERCHWETLLWIDGKAFGKKTSLGTPHIYHLDAIKPGKHHFVLRIDNSKIVNLGNKPHSVSEETAGTWNGIVGKLQLRAGAPVALKNIQLYPNVKNKHVLVKGEIKSAAKTSAVNYTLNVTVEGVSAKTKAYKKSMQLEGNLYEKKDNKFSFSFSMGKDAKLWDEFDPNLYTMKFSLTVATKNGASVSTAKRRFGIREFGRHKTQFTMNGRKTFLRGNVDCAVYPKTGYAPMDEAHWKRIWKTYKKFGLNMARFHSWCPPEAAFNAADEVGIYLAPEVGEWVWVGKQSQFDFLKNESLRILKEYGNHPSFVMMGEGNEAGGDKKFFKNLVDTWKQEDARHLYTIKANSGKNPGNVDYEVVRKVGEQNLHIRYQSGWPPTPLKSFFQAKEPSTNMTWKKAVSSRKIPLIAHETAQITAYPNVMKEIAKYTGYLHPSYLKIAADQLRERGMINQLHDFVEASGKWQVQLTKEEFEADYRTKNLAGFNWFCLADFTGQDTAPVGFTDAFYDTKPYVDPQKVRQWNGPTVLLASFKKRVYTSLRDFKAEVMVSHFGKKDLHLQVNATLKTKAGAVLKSWQLPDKKITQGNAQKLGEISGISETLKAPTHLILSLSSANNDFHNQWDLWVYPKVKKQKEPASIVIAEKWNLQVKKMLEQGKTVLLLPKQKDLNGQLPMCFTNYYWTSFGENGGQSSAAGMLIDDQHPIFKNFATQDHTNWQWWDVLTHAYPMILDSYDAKNPWPKTYHPILQPIDTWKINRKLGLLMEGRVGKGKLMVCSIDLDTDIENRPVTRQFRKNLFDYLQSVNFNPTTKITEKMVEGLFRTQSPKK